MAEISRREDLERKCVSAWLTIVQILERLGVWCFALKGSVYFEFAKEHALSPWYFWTRDKPNRPGTFAGHAWVLAPPFAVVDVTANYQGWERGEARLVPAHLLATAIEFPQAADTLEESDLRFGGLHPRELLADLT